jgi:hypothetical protein
MPSGVPIGGVPEFHHTFRPFGEEWIQAQEQRCQRAELVAESLTRSVPKHLFSDRVYLVGIFHLNRVGKMKFLEAPGITSLSRDRRARLDNPRRRFMLLLQACHLSFDSTGPILIRILLPFHLH